VFTMSDIQDVFQIGRPLEAAVDRSASLSTTEREFREEVIYFIIVDRFFDATSEEEERRGMWDRGSTAGLYDKTWTHWGKYWGGNLLGIIEKIPYLQSLGITAVWLSPLFEQVDDMQFDRAPMHGYWTKDFKRINPRFLPADECNSLHASRTLKHLVEALHAADIKLVLDVVCNHSSPDINGTKGVVYDDGMLLCDYNDDTKGFYHHRAEITDWNDEDQLINGEMCGLATFNENNPQFRSYIKAAIKSWLDVGVDALRVDTLKHMPVWFWQEFSADIKAHKPGTFLFGEYGFGKPWDSRTVRYANQTGMSILDFGLADAIRFAFSGEQPGGFHLVERLLSFDHVYHRANELVTFIDNHDMPRFLSIAPDHRALDQALVLLFTLRGVPCVFYGTEQYLVDNTGGGHDPYNRPMMEVWSTEGQGFNLLQTLIEVRRANQALTFGSHQQLYVSEHVYAFVRSYRDSHAVCVLNKGSQTTLTLPLPGGCLQTELICSLTGTSHSVQHGHVSLSLETGASYLFSLPGVRVNGPVVVTFQLNGIETSPGQRLVVIGGCEELGSWNLQHAYGMEYVNCNTWICEVAFAASAGILVQFKYVLFDANDGATVYENIVPRRLLLPSQGREKVDSLWERT
jgi:cyclomaltodextrin glucanotransferase